MNNYSAPTRDETYHKSLGLASGSMEQKVSKRARVKENTMDGDGWTEPALHSQFVKAIHNLGVHQASPSVIMEHMTLHHADLTSERVKSHLQKFRKNNEKSTADFMQEYESWIQKALTMGAADGAVALNRFCPSTVAKMLGSEMLLGGHVPALLSYQVMMEEESSYTAAPAATHLNVPGVTIPVPVLTDTESRSPLGASIHRVVALCHSMTEYLLQERENKSAIEQQQSASALAGFTEFHGHDTVAGVTDVRGYDTSEDSMDPIALDDETQLVISRDFHGVFLAADDPTEHVPGSPRQEEPIAYSQELSALPPDNHYG